MLLLLVSAVARRLQWHNARPAAIVIPRVLIRAQRVGRIAAPRVTGNTEVRCRRILTVFQRRGQCNEVAVVIGLDVWPLPCPKLRCPIRVYLLQEISKSVRQVCSVCIAKSQSAERGGVQTYSLEKVGTIVVLYAGGESGVQRPCPPLPSTQNQGSRPSTEKAWPPSFPVSLNGARW